MGEPVRPRVEAGIAGAPPIRVAHFIHTMAYGGIETALLNWVRAMDGRRVRASLYCFSNADGSERPFVEAAHALGMDVRTVPWSRRKPIVAAVRRLSRLMREDGIEIVHCHNTYADLVGLLAAKLTGAKAVVTLYVWGRFGFVRNTLQWIDRRLLPFFDQVTVHCEATWRGTVERGFPEARLRLLVCGFEASPLTMTAKERVRRRAELGAGPNDFVLIHVARFWPEKAHDVLLESFRLIVRERPEARLWMLGVGPLLEEIQALAAGMGLEDRVVFLGFRTDLTEMLALADLQIHPSDMEGVPLAICQGMAQGLPIVATRVGGLTEVLKDGHSGILVERRDPGQCARAVLELMADPDRRKWLGKAAARFIAEDYSLAAASQRVERVYLDLMAPKPGLEIARSRGAPAKMRIAILLLAAGRTAGGPETYEVELIRGLARLDRETQFFVYTTEEASATIGVQQPNVHYRVLRPGNRWLAVSLGVQLQMRRDRAEVLHCTYAPPPFASDYVFTMHCVSNLEHPQYYGRVKGLRLNVLHRRALKHAREILCVSSYVRHELSTTYEVPPERTSVVYNGVNCSFRPAQGQGSAELMKNRYGIRGPYMLYVGKLQARKNIVRLIKAFNLFREWNARAGSGAALQLVLAGRRCGPGAGIREAIRNSPYAGDILQIGYVASPANNPQSDLPVLYQQARMFVFPSLHEGFGIPLIEAMACGTPVLASNLTSLPEVANNAALMVDPFSVHDLAKGMTRLQDDEEVRQQLIERGFARAREFTWERCAEQTLAAYQRTWRAKVRSRSQG